MDVVGLPPGFCAAPYGVGCKTRSECIRRDIPVTGPVQRDSEVAKFQDAVGRHEHVARRNVPMDRAAFMKGGHSPEQPYDFSPRTRLRPGHWISFQVPSQVALLDIFGDQAIKWRSTALRAHPRERVVHLNQGRHIPEQMAEVSFPMPGGRMDSDF